MKQLPKELRDIYNCKAIIKDTSDAGCILFQHYLERIEVVEYTFDDETIAEDIGWSVDKVTRIRLELTKAGWFSRRKIANPEALHIQVIYLGKEPPLQISRWYAVHAKPQPVPQTNCPPECPLFCKCALCN